MGVSNGISPDNSNMLNTASQKSHFDFIYCTLLKVQDGLDNTCYEKNVTKLLTFVEALFTVHDGNPVSSDARGSVELTMVLVEFPI